MKKGAVLTLDFLMALLVFTVVFLSMLWLWGKVKTDVQDYSFRMDKREKSLRLSDFLISGRGKPVYWYLLNVTTDNVDSIGLSGKDHELMPRKIQALQDANYTQAKTILGLSREDFNLTITGNYSGVPVDYYSMGRIDENASDQLVMRRLAVLEGEDVEVVLRLSYNVY